MGTISPAFPVADVFHAIQGEGTLAGIPSVFIRLAGCPLRCPWCDTKSAWDADRHPSLGCEEIIERVAKFDCRHAVVTGGEPLANRRIATLIDALRGNKLHTTVETSGIVYRSFGCDLISISPKLPGMTGTSVRSFRPATIRRLIAQCDDYQLKFPVSRYSHVRQVVTAYQRYLSFADPSRVMLMPIAVTKRGYLTTAPKVARWAVRHNLRFCPREQLTTDSK